MEIVWKKVSDITKGDAGKFIRGYLGVRELWFEGKLARYPRPGGIYILHNVAAMAGGGPKDMQGYKYGYWVDLNRNIDFYGFKSLMLGAPNIRLERRPTWAG